MSTLTHDLAEFVYSTPSAAVPPTTREIIAAHLLDTIGVVAAAVAPGELTGAALLRAADLWRSAVGARIYLSPQRCAPHRAALLNGALAQALEMDDKHGSSLARPGASVVPVAIAIAETTGATFADVVDATAIGYEAMIRLGYLGGPRFLKRGYHTSSLLAGFGAVAAAGRLLSAGRSEIVDAFGIAGTFAAGLQESTRTGSTSKVLHGGWGAQAGMQALDLARAGLTGPESILEGHFGLIESHLGTPVTQSQIDEALVGLGSVWHAGDTAIKPYPCCQILHSFIVGSEEIRQQMDEKGVGLDEVQAVRCKVAEPGLTLVTMPAAAKLHPTHPHEARFSLPYVVSHALVHRQVDRSTFAVGALGDDEVARLSDLVTAVDDPDSDYPQHCPARIEVVAHGTTFSAFVPYQPGSPEARWGEEEILTKFADNVDVRLGDDPRGLGAAFLATTPTMPMSAALDALGV